MAYFICGDSFGKVEETFYAMCNDLMIESITFVTPTVYATFNEERKKEIDNNHALDYLDGKLYYVIVG